MACCTAVTVVSDEGGRLPALRENGEKAQEDNTASTSAPSISLGIESYAASRGKSLSMESIRPQESIRPTSRQLATIPMEEQQARIALMNLSYACAEGADQEVVRLCEANANVNARTCEGRSPLHVAVCKGHILVVEALIKYKADPNVIDHMGQTPLYEAELGSHFPIEEFLKEHGARLQQERLKIKAGGDNWAIDRKDIHVGQELSQTLKSKVFRAEWRGTEVVAKVSKLTDDEELRAELLHEIHLLAALRHPDLVMFLGACLEDDAPIMFILEYMPGGDLHNHFKKKRQELGRIYVPDTDMVLHWCVCVARALSFLHNCPKPIVHRDLKPLNLLLTQAMDLKVTDFGISKMCSRKTKRATDQYKMTGGVGSWLYMAPEVVRHQAYTEKVDIYSFALIMYFMSSGHDPFYEMGNDHELVLKEYLKGNEPRPRVQECPKQLRDVIGSAWAVNAEDRPGAFELTGQLHAVPKGKRCGDCSAM